VDANEVFVVDAPRRRRDRDEDEPTPYAPPSDDDDGSPSQTVLNEIDESRPMVLRDDPPDPAPVPPAAANVRPVPAADARSSSDGDTDAADAGPESGRVVVRYGHMQQIGEFRHGLAVPPTPGTKVVIRTERGVELGEVLQAVNRQCSSACRRCINDGVLRDFIRACGDEYPYRRDGKILRLANPQDVVEHRHLETNAREEGAYCRQQIRELNLPMRLVTVEHLLGGERIIFYFNAETRVDFRELVRHLATQYRTRIEMRQVGARDEARLVGDYERCGQRCCCQQFLKDLRPVSMRMAKTQKATLDPSKISGRCGRLMCCLRYEDEGYEELRRQLPHKNIWVKTKDGVVGKVLDGQIITQLVRVLLPDFTQTVIANEEIVERDVAAPPMIEPQQDRRPRRELKEKLPPRLLRDEMGKPPGGEVVRGEGRDAGVPRDAGVSPARSEGISPARSEGILPASESAMGQPSVDPGIAGVTVEPVLSPDRATGGDVGGADAGRMPAGRAGETPAARGAPRPTLEDMLAGAWTKEAKVAENSPSRPTLEDMLTARPAEGEPDDADDDGDEEDGSAGETGPGGGGGRGGGGSVGGPGGGEVGDRRRRRRRRRRGRRHGGGAGEN